MACAGYKKAGSQIFDLAEEETGWRIKKVVSFLEESAFSRGCESPNFPGALRAPGKQSPVFDLLRTWAPGSNLKKQDWRTST